MAWISQKTPLRTLAYFVICLVVTTLLYKNVQTVIMHISKGEVAMFMMLNIVIFQTVNFHHYIVDSIIWKARNKKNRKIMRVS